MFQRPSSGQSQHYDQYEQIAVSKPFAPQAKTIEVGGVKKQVVTQQFNTPLNMYSDESIADAIVKGNHPGYVQSSRPHLPTPKDATFSRPQQSPTFKLILESEMDKARDHDRIMGSELQKHQQQQMLQNSRPNSSMSNRSAPDVS